MKTCPICGKVANLVSENVYYYVACSDKKCILASSMISVAAWNRLPRRDPLAKHKDRVVKAALSYSKFEPVSSGELYSAVTTYLAAQSALRVRHAKK